MDVRKLVTAVGSGVTTFLVVGAVTIEAVTAAVGGDIGPGIVGVGVGALAAVAAAIVVSWGWTRAAGPTRWALLAYAAFGLTILFLAGLSYVNAPGADEYLGLYPNLVIAAVVAIAVAAASRLSDRTPGSA